MGQKQWPPLSQDEYREILSAARFKYKKSNGDEQWFEGYIDGVARKVMLDNGRKEIFDWVLKANAARMGLTREEFYGLSRSAASKAKGVNFIDGGLPEGRTQVPADAPAQPEKQKKKPHLKKR